MDILSALPRTRERVDLAPYTTYKIGGPADFFFEAHSKEALAEAVTAARNCGIPYFILGLGANILVSDDGVEGLVILNRATSIRFEDTALIAESGATVANLIAAATEHELSGLEHYAGIPSTVGGAVWQNLHFLSPDRERTMYIAEVVEGAKILESDGSVHDVDTAYFTFGYDESVLRDRPELTALEVTFRLERLDWATIEERIKANLEWRASRQPDVVEFPSCGSVFKKIEGVGAGRLIEQAGMKGHRVGGIEVSEKHANFLVNRGGGTSHDVHALIKEIQEAVEKTSGYRLETEINFVGR